jgi:hypothetical protein
MRPSGIVIVGFLAVCTIHCASARVVTIQAGRGGVVALPPSSVGGADPQNERAAGEALMAKNCAPNAYKIIEEGEALAGYYSNTQGRMNTHETTMGVGPGMSQTQGYGYGSAQTYSTPTYEWRIRYECVVPGSSSAPASAP